MQCPPSLAARSYLLPSLKVLALLFRDHVVLPHRVQYQYVILEHDRPR